MVGLNVGNKVRFQSAGKHFWGAKAIRDGKWEAAESPLENLTSQMESWQTASGTELW